MSFSSKTADGVTQLVRVVEEPYLIEWEAWETMRLADSPGRRLFYEADGGMSCNIEQDILPAQAYRPPQGTPPAGAFLFPDTIIYNQE